MTPKDTSKMINVTFSHREYLLPQKKNVTFDQREDLLPQTNDSDLLLMTTIFQILQVLW